MSAERRSALVAAALVLALGLDAQAGWQWLYYELGNDNAVLDVSMADERTACAVGVVVPPGGSNSAPLVVCTGDGGQSWRPVQLGGTGLIMPVAVAMVDSQVGFLSTFEMAGWPPQAKIYRTDDGGRTWVAQALPGPPQAMLSDLFCLDAQHCWAVGSTLALWTADGATWQAASLPDLGADRVLNGAFMLDSLRGFAVGGKPEVAPANEWEDPIPPCCGFVLGTSDGGHSWQMLADGFDGELRRAWFLDALHGWAAGGSASYRLLSTSDGGVTWSPLSLPAGAGGAPTYVMDVIFAAPDAGYAVANVGDGNPMVYTSLDGQAWQLDGTYADAFADLSGMDRFVAYSPLIAATFPAKGVGMVCGKNALIVGFTGQGFCQDADADGHQSATCGGDDCDDQNQYINPSAAEQCNHLDENCDGVADDGFDFARDPRNCGECGFNCQPAQVCWDSRCTTDCPAGLTRCGQYCADVQTDLAHCGDCDQPCVFAHAAASCAAGICTPGECDAGWVDLDGNSDTGCEYACAPAGPEACDGQDNDCDGQTDEGLSDCGAEPDGGLPDGGEPDGGGEGGDGVDASSSAGCGQASGSALGLSLLLLGLVVRAWRRQTC
jgi:photosystem II stability/assembly factor-like uncharacterized protein